MRCNRLPQLGQTDTREAVRREANYEVAQSMMEAGKFPLDPFALADWLAGRLESQREVACTSSVRGSQGQDDCDGCVVRVSASVCLVPVCGFLYVPAGLLWWDAILGLRG